MIKVISTETMREVEAAVDASGYTYADMMLAAGRAVAERVKVLVADTEDAWVTILVGKGNNGGDGLVAGRIIAEETSANVRFYLLSERDESDENYKAVVDAGLFIANADDDQRYRVLKNMIASSTVVLDALFGIGVRLPIEGDASKLLQSVNQVLGSRFPLDDENITVNPLDPSQKQTQTPRPYILAVDCPSGLDCDTGKIDNETIFADETITFIAAKHGLFSPPGSGAAGKLSIATLGVSPDTDGLKSAKHYVVDADLVRDLLPDRPVNSNKGTFGKALVVAGCINYVGAPGMAARAAYRSGAGLVTVGAPGPVVNTLASNLLEPTWLLLAHDMGVLSEKAAPVILDEAAKYTALLIGPGMAQEDTTRDLLITLFSDEINENPPKRNNRRIGFAVDNDDKATPHTQTEGVDKALPPLVIDADGLNLLSKIEAWWSLLPENTVITPHPGEMGRLAGMNTAEIQAERWRIASEKATEWHVILLLKGANTLIAHPDGSVYVLPFKTDALASAGTGDVLSGLIVGLLAQGVKPLDAAVVGGYIHGLAAQLLEKRGDHSTRSVIAGDVLEAIPAAFAALERN